MSDDQLAKTYTTSLLNSRNRWNAYLDVTYRIILGNAYLFSFFSLLLQDKY